jgi:hypothetical protein
LFEPNDFKKLIFRLKKVEFPFEYSGNHLTHLTDCGNCLAGWKLRK